jgi:hypothetical protein
MTGSLLFPSNQSSPQRISMRDKMLDHTTAEEIRDMLSEIQMTILEDGGIATESRNKLVHYISAKGFRLVDDLEGVVR